MAAQTSNITFAEDDDNATTTTNSFTHLGKDVLYNADYNNAEQCMDTSLLLMIIPYQYVSLMFSSVSSKTAKLPLFSSKIYDVISSMDKKDDGDGDGGGDGDREASSMSSS